MPHDTHVSTAALAAPEPAVSAPPRPVRLADLLHSDARAGAHGPAATAAEVAPVRRTVTVREEEAPAPRAGGIVPPPAMYDSEPPPGPYEPAAPAAASVQLAPPSPLTGHRLPVGAHPGNTGGRKGRSGRRSDAFHDMCARLSTGKAVKRELGRILENGDHPHFMRALDFVAERGHGKVTQPLDHKVGVTLAELLAPVPLSGSEDGA